MPYDPCKHHRRSVRLKGYDYSQEGAYFVTICTHQRQTLFGDIDNKADMIASQLGDIAREEWENTTTHRPYVEVDSYVIMPNHTHAIIVIDKEGMARHASTQTPKFSHPLKGALGTIVGAYKAAVTKHIHLLGNTPKAIIWQRGIHDAIIRDERMLNTLRAYMQNNPALWAEDRHNPHKM